MVDKSEPEPSPSTSQAVATHGFWRLLTVSALSFVVGEIVSAISLARFGLSPCGDYAPCIDNMSRHHNVGQDLACSVPCMIVGAIVPTVILFLIGRSHPMLRVTCVIVSFMAGLAAGIWWIPLPY